MIKKFVLLTVFMFALFSVTSYAAEPLFENYVALGDSLTHGFQSGSVDETRQPFGFAPLLAAQMETEFNLPLLKFPGYLVNIEDVGKGNIRWWEYYYPMVGGVRVDDYKDQDILNNFGITGATAAEAMTHSGSEGEFFELVLGKDGAPALDQALAKDPTFVSVWLGNNDVLAAAVGTDTAALTPIEDFRRDFKVITDRIASTESIQGVIIMTVPDVTCIAYLDEVSNADFPEGSYKPFWLYDVTEGLVLTPDEVALIRERTAEINEEINNVAYANGWAIIDVNEVFMDMKAYGHELRDQYGMGTGVWVATNYLGGIFSLDGVHLSTTGYAMSANYMIEGINDTYGTQLEYVDEYQASQNDSLFQDPYDPRGLINGWIGKSIYFLIDLFM